MDNLLNDLNVSRKCFELLDGLVNEEKNSGLLMEFESAILFLATVDKVLVIKEVGLTQSSVTEAMEYLQRQVTIDATPFCFQDCLVITIPFTKGQGKGLCYLGVVVQSDMSNIELYRSLLVELCEKLIKEAEFMSFESQDVLEVSVGDILKNASYEIEFRKLSHSFVRTLSGIIKNRSGIVICERIDSDFIVISSSEGFERKQSSSVAPEHFSNDVLSERSDRDRFLYEGALFFKELKWNVITIFENPSEVFGCIIFSFATKNEATSFLKQTGRWVKDFLPLFSKGYHQEKVRNEGRRRDLLLQVTKKFHSTMNIGEVLGEIIYALEQVYPSFQVNLLLSHEWEVKEGVPIKQLMYGSDSGNRTAEHAYLTGLIQIERIESKDKVTLYAPLRGKQGVYGVMEIQASADVRLPKHEIDFIEMLADTGGNALENAELYQQSRKLIHDLQLINQTSHQLNLNLRLADTINFMTEQIINSFEAEQVGFILFQSNGEFVLLEGSTSFFTKESLEDLEPFIRKVKREKDPIYIGDAQLHDEIKINNYHSVLAVPMIQSTELKGLVIAAHSEPYHFTFDSFKLLQSLIHHSTLAFTNSMLHEELEKLVITDHLTRLYSRNHLDEKIQESMMRDVEGTFLLLDIDNFKQINDTFGHQVGDDIIIQVANIMKKNIREEDIAARWGGEELAIYLPKVDVYTGFSIAERVVKAVAIETSPRVTVSCGVSHWQSHDLDSLSSKTLFNLADQGLYVAKETGKNKAVLQLR
ncbi:diguanylate cyclase [Halalkalibacter urbisdiaboli]|uniref:diguanylate cyclase n=1 Tax=Halalkalibacter urbisdiaboli TaxID=1960589 RepID=UPI001FDAB7CD|nr:diguanylate cyclase [Halalkalibacter urbisdiaboli]